MINDVSEREWQLEHGTQWDKGKGFDTFGLIGPWLVTKDEIADPQQFDMWLEVDGHLYQNGSTKTMVFGVAALVSYLSKVMSLQPGDVIFTGTPPGVGMGVTGAGLPGRLDRQCGSGFKAWASSSVPSTRSKPFIATQLAKPASRLTPGRRA